MNWLIETRFMNVVLFLYFIQFFVLNPGKKCDIQMDTLNDA